MVRRIAIFVCFVLGIAAPGHAADYHIDPAAGGSGRGTADAPFDSLVAARGVLKGGDRVILAAGDYGAIRLKGWHFDPPLRIEAAPEAVARADVVAVSDSSGLHIAGLSVWPVEPRRGKDLVLLQPDTRNIVIEGFDIRGAADADRFQDWPRERWVEPPIKSGVMMKGSGNAVTGSRITGVNFGIRALGPRARVVGNHVNGFAGDGLRGLGDGSVFRGNRIENCVKVNRNHDDAFQSWARKGPDGLRPVSGIVIENNMMLEWTGRPGHPLRCRLQGIGMFNGPYRDFVIRNNVISVSAYHGIALYSTRNALVANNTVVHADGAAGKNPWIRLQMGKNPSARNHGNVFVNNVATHYVSKPDGITPIDMRRNAVVPAPLRVFPGLSSFDFTPGAQSGLVDRADPRYAPPTDVTGRPRPVGAGPDFGAVERR